MKRSPVRITAFCTASALSALVWLGLFHESRDRVPGPPANETQSAARFDARAWQAGLAAAETAEARLRAARQLERLTTTQLEAALEETALIESGRLTMAARLLLSRWASRDGEAAMDWAWRRFRSEPVWREAFREITAAWSWNQPAQLQSWALHMLSLHTPEGPAVLLATALQSEFPILDTGAMHIIINNLMRSSPSEAVALLLAPNGLHAWLPDVTRRLQSVAAVQEALSTFGDLDALDWSLTGDSATTIDARLNNRVTPETIATALLRRWQELDAEDFDQSPYAAHLPAPAQPGSRHYPGQPQTFREQFFRTAAPPESEIPDPDIWPPDTIEALKDYQALMGISG